jgi:hypothetical protein
MSTAQFTKEEVAKHNSFNDCWMSINGRVYDVTGFLAEHPAGSKIMMMHAGKDCTKYGLVHPPPLQRICHAFMFPLIIWQMLAHWHAQVLSGGAFRALLGLFHSARICRGRDWLGCHNSAIGARQNAETL